MQKSEEADVLIVGAGPGGLAAALLLAHSGLKVTILEKSDGVGGRTRLIHKDGFTYDRGPTFFHFPEVCEEIFQAIGLDAHKELGLIRLEPSYRLVFGEGGSIDATSDLELMTEGKAAKLKQGHAVFFASFIRHRVTPVIRGNRKSLVMWFGGTPFK